MDVDDQSDPNVQGSSSEGSFPHSDWAAGRDSRPVPPTGRRSIVRGLAGQWWRILLLWLLVSSPVAYLIFTFVEPTYEATSLLQAGPAPPAIYGPGLWVNPKEADDRSYLLTQVQLIKSQSILDAALAKPAISSVAMIRSSKDPKADLRERLRVEIIGDNTYLLRVSLDSRDPDEAAAIVNAVVESYIELHRNYSQVTNRSLRRDLKTERERLGQQIEEKYSELTKLAATGEVGFPRLVVAGPVNEGDTKGPVESSVRSVPEEQFQEISNRLIRADFELLDARARLDAARRPNAQTPAEKIRELESAFEEAGLKRTSYKRYVAQVKVEVRPQNAEQLRASLLNQDLAYLKKLHDTITQKLAQVEFEIGQDAYRIMVRNKATVPKAPSSNRRLIDMPIALAGLLLLILGVFLVRETRAMRGEAPEATA